MDDHWRSPDDHYWEIGGEVMSMTSSKEMSSLHTQTLGYSHLGNKILYYPNI